MKFSQRSALVAIFLMAVSIPNFAQTSTVLSGTVIDPSNALVPDAQVTSTSRTTRAIRTDKTDASGAYNFVQLQPGLYGLKAEKQGFKTTAIGELEVLVNTAPRINLKITEVGSVAETIVITAYPFTYIAPSTPAHKFIVFSSSWPHPFQYRKSCIR